MMQDSGIIENVMKGVYTVNKERLC